MGVILLVVHSFVCLCLFRTSQNSEWRSDNSLMAIFQARIGPMFAPYIADLGATNESIPIGIFGVVALIAR